MSRSIIACLLSTCLILTAPLAGLSRQKSPEAPNGQAQQPATNTSTPTSTDKKIRKQSEEVKRKVQSLGTAARVTVLLNNGNEYYGGVSQIGEETFDLLEIDLKQQITIDYKDVKKVRSGFGNPNPFNGKRWSTNWHKAVLVATLGVFLILIPLSIPKT